MSPRASASASSSARIVVGTGDRSLCRSATTNLTWSERPTLGQRRRSKLFCHMQLETIPSAMNGPPPDALAVGWVVVAAALAAPAGSRRRVCTLLAAPVAGSSPPAGCSESKGRASLRRRSRPTSSVASSRYMVRIALTHAGAPCHVAPPLPVGVPRARRPARREKRQGKRRCQKGKTLVE
eukprot:scaffold163574_cov28-Tisochrysis_lutea.AAC.4